MSFLVSIIPYEEALGQNCIVFREKEFLNVKHDFDSPFPFIQSTAAFKIT